MEHIDPTRCDPRVSPTTLFAETAAQLRGVIARRRAEAQARHAKEPKPYPRILGFRGEWTPEMRRAEAHMAANERRFTGEPPTGFGEL